MGPKSGAAGEKWRISGRTALLLVFLRPARFRGAPPGSTAAHRAHVPLVRPPLSSISQPENATRRFETAETLDIGRRGGERGKGVAPKCEYPEKEVDCSA